MNNQLALKNERALFLGTGISTQLDANGMHPSQLPISLAHIDFQVRMCNCNGRHVSGMPTIPNKKHMFIRIDIQVKILHFVSRFAGVHLRVWKLCSIDPIDGMIRYHRCSRRITECQYCA